MLLAQFPAEGREGAPVGRSEESRIVDGDERCRGNRRGPVPWFNAQSGAESLRAGVGGAFGAIGICPARAGLQFGRRGREDTGSEIYC